MLTINLLSLEYASALRCWIWRKPRSKRRTLAGSSSVDIDIDIDSFIETFFSKSKSSSSIARSLATTFPHSSRFLRFIYDPLLPSFLRKRLRFQYSFLKTNNYFKTWSLTHRSLPFFLTLRFLKYFFLIYLSFSEFKVI